MAAFAACMFAASLIPLHACGPDPAKTPSPIVRDTPDPPGSSATADPPDSSDPSQAAARWRRAPDVDVEADDRAEVLAALGYASGTAPARAMDGVLFMEVPNRRS